MIEKLEAMPNGTTGFRAGTVSADEYRQVLRPEMRGRAWTRTALVTDVDWVARALHMFGWMTPGEVKLYDLDGLDDAKAWVAERPQ